MRLIPKNWHKFQHYKNRNPPWIKIHRDLLNNKDYLRLPIASKALAPLLWLLACESDDGSFDSDFDELEFRLRFTKKELEQGINPLIEKGFFIDASTMLAPCVQHATTERETETEGKAKRKSPTKTFIPKDFTVSERVLKWAKEKNYTNLRQHLDSFIDKCNAKGYQYVDWDSAFMNAIRDNWAKVEVKNPMKVSL